MTSPDATPKDSRRVVLLDPAVVRLCERLRDNRCRDVTELATIASYFASEVLAGLQDWTQADIDDNLARLDPTSCKYVHPNFTHDDFLALTDDGDNPDTLYARHRSVDL